ncbi:N/A [soil metagenome]
MNSTSGKIPRQSIEHAISEHIQQGNIEAFSKLYDKYAPILNGVILKITGDKKIAEEILQKSFMRLWMEISSFDPMKDSLLMWMLAITRNTAFAAAEHKIQPEEIRVAENSVNTQNPASTPNRSRISIPSIRYEAQSPAMEMLYFKGYNLTRAAHELNITVDVLKTKIRMEFKMHGGMKSNG